MKIINSRSPTQDNKTKWRMKLWWTLKCDKQSILSPNNKVNHIFKWKRTLDSSCVIFYHIATACFYGLDVTRCQINARWIFKCIKILCHQETIKIKTWKKTMFCINRTVVKRGQPVLDLWGIDAVNQSRWMLFNCIYLLGFTPHGRLLKIHWNR